MCVIPHDVKIEAMGLAVDDGRSVNFAQLLVVILVSPFGIIHGYNTTQTVYGDVEMPHFLILSKYSLDQVSLAKARAIVHGSMSESKSK